MLAGKTMSLTYTERTAVRPFLLRYLVGEALDTREARLAVNVVIERAGEAGDEPSLPERTRGAQLWKSRPLTTWPVNKYRSVL